MRQEAKQAEKAERRELPFWQLRAGHYVRNRLENWAGRLREREEAWHGFKDVLREHGLAEEYEQLKAQKQEQERGQVIEHEKFLEHQQQREQDRGRGRSWRDN
jgi:hypothetical protein